MNRMKKITITAGLALALTVGLGTTAKSAWAGYLGTQSRKGQGIGTDFNDSSEKHPWQDNIRIK